MTTHDCMLCDHHTDLHGPFGCRHEYRVDVCIPKRCSCPAFEPGPCTTHTQFDCPCETED